MQEVITINNPLKYLWNFMLYLGLVDFWTFVVVCKVCTYMNYYFWWGEVLVSLVFPLFVQVALDFITVDFKFQILL